MPAVEPPPRPGDPPHPGRHRAGPRHPWWRSRTAWAVGAVALVVLVAGAVTVAVVLSGSSRQAAPQAGASPSAPPSRSGGGTASGTELTRWAGTELPAGLRLVAAPGVADALRRAGVPADVVNPSGAAAPGGALVVTGGDVPAGSRLVARFGDPPAWAVVDPAPVPPTAAELQRRRDLAAAVLANPTTRVSGPAAATLRAAAVDPRLLSVLAALTARSGIGIAALPAAADEPDDVPLARSVLIDRLGDAPATAGSPGADELVSFLRAQLPPYAPARITPTPAGVLVDDTYLGNPDAVVTTASY